MFRDTTENEGDKERDDGGQRERAVKALLLRETVNSVRERLLLSESFTRGFNAKELQ